jgi:hypothetical protein
MVPIRGFAATLIAASALFLLACGGDDPPAPVDTTTQFTPEQVKESFERATGHGLTVETSEFGGPVRLVYEDDGDPAAVSPTESEVIGELGAFTIYVVEEGDPESEFALIVGESGNGEPLDYGGDTVTYRTEVASEPDGDGILWKETCAEYETDVSLNSCYWSASKQYGANVLATWSTEANELDQAGEDFDAVMSSLGT